MTAPGDRPLADLLDTFWQGRVPAAPEVAGPVAPAVDELGPSGITVRGRPLEAALEPAYRRFTGTG
ncbi:hypothetical protein OH807_07610 [Kitasatospora sp. NBC_01560]|uniref:hypothetical protein n=1 Tax=Kitasatospora sp. NBC_01560 TaxID=2975965 RepID=UPI0038638FCD